MELMIENQTELNAAVVRLNAHVIQMCNDKTTDDVCKDFVTAKDLLVAIYKYNVEKRNLPTTTEKK